MPKVALASVCKPPLAYRFCRSQRLLKTDDFSSVFRFRQCRGQRWLQVCVRPNSLGHARLGLVVGRKTNKRAVARNYIKRTIREIFRREQHRLGSFDLVVRSRECFGRTERADVDTALTALLLKLAPCPASSSSLSASTS